MKQKIQILKKLLEDRNRRDNCLVDSIGYDAVIGARIQERSEILEELDRMLAE